MPQEPDFTGFATLRDVVKAGLPQTDENLDYKADILIDKFSIQADAAPGEASGGEKRKAALARALISEPDILLLDEPTNHLDMPSIEKLEEIIAAFRGAVIVISHDRMFLGNVSETMFWLDRGTLRRSNRGFKYFDEWQEQVIDQEIIEQKYLNKKIEEETEWLHKGVTARRRRNMGRLRRLQQLRLERKEQIKRIGSIDLEIAEGDFRSKLVIEAKHIFKSFGSRDIVKDFSVRIIKGNKIGIVGPNGAGKTTLIKLLTRRLEPDSGFVRLGKNLEEAYFDQNRITLDPKKTLWQTLCGKGDHIWVRGQYRHVVAYLKDFLFRPDQAQCPVSALSAGRKPPHAGSSAGPAFQFFGLGRTDQRFGYGYPGFVAGSFGRLCRNRSAGQPRPGFYRPGRHIGNLYARRRNSIRTRRQLQRLAGQAFCPYCRCAGQKTAQTRNLPPVRSGGTGQDCPPQLQSTASVGGSSLRN